MKPPTLLALLLLAALPACGGGKATKSEPPRHYAVGVAAEAGANPDGEGRASPVVVRVYAVDDAAEFMAADFQGLYAAERGALPAGWRWRHELLLAPGATQSLDADLPPPAAQLCALAAFRDIRASRWRACAPLPSPAAPLRVQVGATAIEVQ